jgi:hypothetical protein
MDLNPCTATHHFPVFSSDFLGPFIRSFVCCLNPGTPNDGRNQKRIPLFHTLFFISSTSWTFPSLLPPPPSLVCTMDDFEVTVKDLALLDKNAGFLLFHLHDDESPTQLPVTPFITHLVRYLMTHNLINDFPISILRIMTTVVLSLASE